MLHADNNFDIIRLVAAFGVLVSHATSVNMTGGRDIFSTTLRAFAPISLGQLCVLDWEKIERKRVRLSQLRAHIYGPQGDRYLPIYETPASLYLRGDKESYASYHQYENSYDTHSSEQFEKLLRSIHEKGYSRRNLIVVFNDEMIIRDGQHRAAALYHYFGDIEIEVANVVIRG